MFNNKKLTIIFLSVVILTALFLIYSPIAQAQNWAALPPYNTLWPLWSPTYAPIDAVTGLPVPIINELTPNTILPVQPGLTWDPSDPNPWLLYNTPLGMAYYEPLGGVNLWPPSSFLGAGGAALPIGLPTDYGYLPATDPAWLQTNVPTGNIAAYFYLKSLFSLGLGTGPAVLPTTFIPSFAGIPLFSGASALIPPASALLPYIPPLPIIPPTIIAPLPITAIAPLPITAIAPPITAIAPPITAIAPPITAIAPPAISGALALWLASQALW